MILTIGVCKKCQEKLSWRFQYDKYKPLTKIATCQNCRGKCITKAYRTFCDSCALVKLECPGCCCPMNASEANVSNEVIVDNEDEKYDGYDKTDEKCRREMIFQSITGIGSRIVDD